jgi:hypothetical protein
MAQGSPAADSSTHVTANLIQEASAFFGVKPAFWGRYFTSVTTKTSVEYSHAAENKLLGAAGVPVLPIARQTPNVGGNMAQGIADGHANAQDFIVTFGLSLLVAQGPVFYMFLDVEKNPSLSLAYYTGWVQGLAQMAEMLSNGTVKILPCVYAGVSDVATWEVVHEALSAGIPCQGAWVARYHSGVPALGPWDVNILTPASPSPFICPILMWQYAENGLNGQIDCTQTNPGIDAMKELLPFLVTPPA